MLVNKDIGNIMNKQTKRDVTAFFIFLGMVITTFVLDFVNKSGIIF